MTNIKTAELAGAPLDWCVLSVDTANLTPYKRCIMQYPSTFLSYWVSLMPGDVAKWRPSASWQLGGSIIERERLSLSQFTTEGGELVWSAAAFHSKRYGYGPTPLVAAMRAYVSSKIGAYADLPGELLEFSKSS